MAGRGVEWLTASPGARYVLSMVDVRRAASSRARAWTSTAMTPLRRGSRVVQQAPQTGLGFGNFLYLWFAAHRRQHRGEDCRVLTPSAMNPWLSEFPALRELAVCPREVRPRDRRRRWTFDLSDRFGTDFTREDLGDFVRRRLLGGGAYVRSSAHGPGALTLSIRRGNYYSVPHVRGTYSFDIPAYLEVALSEAERCGGDISTLIVVSDGIEWCRERLDPLLRSHAASIVYAVGTPQENFRAVATSGRLIGTNSTFSYWGGYVNDVLYGSAAQVIMPRFHARLGTSNRAYQLDPAWTVVEDIPGGWDS